MKKVLILLLLPLFVFSNISVTDDSLLLQKALEENEEKKDKIEKKIFLAESKKTLQSLIKQNDKYYSYYETHEYIPFFVDENGVKSLSYDLLIAIKKDQVLKPFLNELFDIQEIENKINSIDLNEENIYTKLTKIDIELLDMYINYMQYLSNGFLNWREFENRLKEHNKQNKIISQWRRYNTSKNSKKLLVESMIENDIYHALNKANYTFPQAQELANKIEYFEIIIKNGGYEQIPTLNKSLRQGDYYTQIPHLRKRLFQSKDLSNINCYEKGSNCLQYYDENLFQAVQSFQKRHGLEVDGIVGPKTFKALNTSLEEKVKKMRVNLERMRWLPRTLGEKYLLVNIPEFKLRMYKEGEIKLAMSVVVGETKNPTPIFSNKISSVVLNPYWRIPNSIVYEEILPKLRKDPNYLYEQGINLHKTWYHKSSKYNPGDFNWHNYKSKSAMNILKSMPVRFIQEPNEKNPLGKVKFLFPNVFSVYIHDTPYKELFKHHKRAFSHGCVRLEQPYLLLEKIASEDESINFEESLLILEDIQRKYFTLDNTIPIHIVYLTSWIDENGVVHFRDDIYGFDKMQEEILYKNL